MTAFNARRNEALAYDILTPEAARRAGHRHRATAAVDAEFVTIREPAAHQPGNDNGGSGADARNAAPLSGFASFASQAEGRLSRLSVNRFSALVAALFIAVFTLAGGLSGFFAEESAPAPTAPLSFAYANLTPQEANGMQLLAVNGIVMNTSGKTVALPSIRADLMNGTTLVASVIIDPPVSEVKPGQSHGFATRIVHPGGKTPELRLSFAGADVSAP